MADGVNITAGSGVVIASDDIGGVQYQRVKISQGADGAAIDVSSAAPLQVTLANTGANATPLVVDLGANNDVSLNAGTNYVGKVRLTDGTTDGEVVPLAGYNAQAVAIVDGSGAQITSFGGGVQYTEGDTDVSITGTAIMFETNTGTSALGTVSSTNPLPISDNGGSLTVDGTFWQATQPVSGTVTANAGTGTMAVSNTVLSVVGGGTEATAQRVTIANDSTGVLSIDDNGGSITVDGTVAVSGTVTVASHAVTNAGTFVVQENGAALTSLQLIDDTIATLGTTTYTEASTKGAIIGAVRRDANTTLVDTTNEVAPLQVNATGELKVAQIQALPAGTNNIGDVDVLTLPALPAGTNNIGDVDVLTVNGVAPAFGSGVRGATVQRVTIATDDSVPVTIASVPSHAVTNAGTFAVQAASAGDVANDGADSGNPIKVGGVATVTEQTAVSASGDRVNASFTSTGKQIVAPFSSPEYFVSGAITSAMTGTTSTSLVAAPGASLRNYITTIIVSNSHATVGTDVAIQDGSGGTTLLTIPAAAVYGGAVINLPVPLRQPTTNTALYCANVTTGASTKVSAVGYKGI